MSKGHGVKRRKQRSEQKGWVLRGLGDRVQVALCSNGSEDTAEQAGLIPVPAEGRHR